MVLVRSRVFLCVTSRTDRAEVADACDDTVVVEPCGVVDAEAIGCTTEQLESAAGKLLLGNRAGLVPHSGVLAGKFDPEVWAGGFPTLFPYGIGTPFDPGLDGAVAVRRYARHTLRLKSDIFRRHPAYAFFMFDWLQILDACREARLVIRRPAAAVVDQLASITADDVRRALSLDHTPLVEATGAAAVAGQPSQDAEAAAVAAVASSVDKVKLLRKEMFALGGNVRGSHFERRTYRNELLSLHMFLGNPTFFITVSPCDVRHPLVCFLAGHESVLIRDRFPDGLPGDAARATLVAEDPAAAADSFHILISAMIHCFFEGGDTGVGIFGKISAYYGTVEAQGRGTLHLHLLLWLESAPRVAEFVDRMTHDARYRTDVLSFLEEHIRLQFPGVCVVPRTRLTRFCRHVAPVGRVLASGRWVLSAGASASHGTL